MGIVKTEITLKNLSDEIEAKIGSISREDIRQITVLILLAG